MPCCRSPRRDHPRACGEHTPRDNGFVLGSGSSPRMRGALDKFRMPDGTIGIIPAHAGSTAASRRRHNRWQDHPRACGEHESYAMEGAVQKGSSPRMRGAQSEHEPCARQRGIIPAHAGSTIRARAMCTTARDHPRACGEHNPSTSHVHDSEGSSPRMRGAQSEHEPCARQRGIIPAHAGSTAFRGGNTHANRDHPRACGEHAGRSRVRESSPGSSPRMRGAHTCAHMHTGGSGIIPAHAGSTTLIRRILIFTRDHPRACGEHDDGPHV